VRGKKGKEGKVRKRVLPARSGLKKRSGVDGREIKWENKYEKTGE